MRMVGSALLAVASWICTLIVGVWLGPSFTSTSSTEPSSAPFLPNCGEKSGSDSLEHLADASIDDIFNASDIPASFDTRTEWYGCGQFVVNQGQCGDCWAASAANTLGDRACIHLKADGTAVGGRRGGAGGIGATERMFQIQGRCVGAGTDGLAHHHGCERKQEFPSPQRLVSCGSTNRDNLTPPTFNADDGFAPGVPLYNDSTGCNGGSTEDSWRYFYYEGLTTFDSTQKAGCTPYTSDLCSGKDPNNNGCRSCSAFDQCADTGLKPEPIRVHSFGYIMDKDLPERPITGMPRTDKDFAALDRQVKKMQVEMLTNGPLHVCIDDYANFGTFFNLHGSGIYNSTEGTPMTGGHCIELIGWGVDRESGLPYWTFKNSWGTSFASAGYARWLRGVDLCGIESDVYAGCPSNSDCELTAGVVVERAQQRGLQAAGKPAVHPTSAAQPSRSWSGGKEIELTREAFSHGHIAPLVATAVRKARGDPTLSMDAALREVQRVWSRSLNGLRVRVELMGHGASVLAHQHVGGHIEAL
jgi:hypothetical protein